MDQRVYFAGTPDEVAHHAAPLAERLSVEILRPELLLDEAAPGDLVIVTTEHFDRFRDCVRQLKQRNVATLYMIDGILEWRNAWENAPEEPACPFTMRPALAHKIACIGPSQARILNGWGNAGRVEVTGVPRFDRLAGLKPPEPDPDRFRLLVMTAKCPAFTVDQRMAIERSLRDLKAWLEGHPAIGERRIEVHWRLTGGLDRTIGVENETTDLSGMELARVLTQVDAVIATPTTGILESMRIGLPTGLLDYTLSPHYVSAGWCISAAEHLDRVLPQLARPEPARMFYQEQMLRDALYLDEPATERFCRLAERMLEFAGRAVQSTQSVTFPDRLLDGPLEVGRPTAFESARLFPDYPQFCEDDPVVLQTEWAHARREIRHLHDRIAQLEQELGQAHEIFDQIRSHPIAGPVVRAREKMLAFIARMRPADTADAPAMDSAESAPIARPR